MSIFDYSRLTSIATLGSSVTGSSGNLVINTVGTKTFIRTIILHNTDTVARTVSLFYTPATSSTTPTTASHRFWHGSIDSNSTVMIEIPAPGIILSSTNDTIKGMASISSVVTVQIYGGTE